LSQFYTVIDNGETPVCLEDMKTYLKVNTSSDDALIESLINACTSWSEKYSGRDFSPKTWELLIDCFADRIELKRSPIDSITSVEHIVDGSFVLAGTVDVDFYLKKKIYASEILLFESKSWPTTTDDREQAIKVTFNTGQIDCLEQIEAAIKRCVAHLYRNRGDCCEIEDAAKASGTTTILDSISIPRL
jgi:uncharacterized phiE125 gp8 family phage protein